MKEKPIIFSTPMVRAILAGRKTQTRRIMNFCKKIEPENYSDVEFTRFQHYADSSYRAIFNTDEHPFSIICPYGKVGNILWVRETWNTLTEYVEKPDYSVMSIRDFVYKADDDRIDKWKPSIFMPKAACRIKLQVTNIRVERVQDISKEDAIAEGIESTGTGETGSPVCYRNYLSKGAKFFHSFVKGKDDYHRWTAIDSYKTLWESINGEGSWDKNPWVWCLSFKKI
jgi:hypothetical protein